MPANRHIARPAASIAVTSSAEAADLRLSDTIVGGDGGPGNDLITEANNVSANGGADTVFGTDGDDVIAGYNFFEMGFGADRRDELHGGKGADLMSGNAGADTLTGGDGADNLYGAVFGNAKRDGDGADLIDGGGGDDFARGNTGSDTLLGGAGDDNLGGQWGTDLVDGGAGHDVASFLMAAEPEAVRFSAARFVPGETIVMVDTMGARDTLVSIEELFITGSAFNDTLIGSSSRDRLFGDNGDDRVDGRDGDDFISSHAGSSTLSGGDGDDVLQLFAIFARTSDYAGGHDVVDGGEGDDLLSFEHESDTVVGVTGALGADGTFALLSEDGDLSIAGEGIEAVRLTGGAGSDRFTGGEGDDWLAGVRAQSFGDGDDTLAGGDGDDTLSGGHGNNTIAGGAGNDIYVLYQPAWTESDPIFLDAYTYGFDVSGGSFTVQTAVGVDTVSGIEGVGLSGSFGDDTLLGSDGSDRLEGGEGNDSIEGGAGDDTIVMAPSFNGQDSHNGLDEIIRGGEGFDTMTFHLAVGPVLVDLAQGRMSYVDQGEAPEMVGLITGVEGVVGSSRGDTLIGAGRSELLSGFEGADSLTGAAGKDTLVGGWGADRLDGGSGRDVFVYNSAQESAVNGADRIAGFTLGDTIDLSGVDADATIDGDQAFTRVRDFDGHAGQLAVDYSLGVTTVSGDLDGDGAADFRIELDGNHKADLDFIL